MIIGIDVDGTLIDIGEFMLKKGEAYFQRPASDPEAFDVEHMFAVSNKEGTRFWLRQLLSYCIRAPLISGAAETIRRLKEDGHRIIIITSRVYTAGTGPMGFFPRSVLKRWLKKRGVIYDAIVFCQGSAVAKAKECARHLVDVMIDDIPDNLLAISKDRAVIAYPMPWNRDMADKGIPRAKDWQDIYDMLTQ